MSTYTKLTSKTNKAKCGAVNKHCKTDGCNGKLLVGDGWSKHCDRIHSKLGKNEIYFDPCVGDSCLHC